MNQFEDRKFVLLGIFLSIGLVFLLRLFYLQVINDDFKLSARNQSVRKVTQHAPRGLIFDRNGEVLAYNQSAYDLMVVPRQVGEMDTLAFCELIGITLPEFKERMAKARTYSSYRASVFEKQITGDEWTYIAERLHPYNGFFGEKRSLRQYPGNAAAHVLGYISEVTGDDIKADPYYKPGDFIGSNGLEHEYELALRGKRGSKMFLKDVHNVVKGSLAEGKYDTLAVEGQNLISTLDLVLQQYGELLMQNKRGSIVAIEPSTGEILALISSPNYNPNLLVGRNRTMNYRALAANDSLDPLFNRALMAKYPPGSIFKIVQALIGMEKGVLTPNTGYACNKSLVGCHNHAHPNNVHKAIQFSCNPYFYHVFKTLIQQGKSPSIFKDSEIGLAEWQKEVMEFGLGRKPAIDQPYVKSGYVPGVEHYDRWYGHHRWAFSTIYSLSIGQGELEVVPLQMANLAAIIANRGWFYEPHLVKQVGNEGKKPAYTERQETNVNPDFFPPVIDAMQSVVEEPGGTARRARTNGITVCGKTGTAENPHGEDHSVFMAFAPKENPQIAIAVYIENAGFGGTWAAPVASLMIEQYMTGTVADTAKENRILRANLMNVEKDAED